MKRSFTGLFSVLLCLVMLLAVLPLGVQAEEDSVPAGYTRVYCQAPGSWSTCKVYWWGRENFNPEWPGVDMKHNSDGLWTYDVPSDAVGLIFNDSNGIQSADLQLPTDENNMFVFTAGQWTTYGPVVIEQDYFVAGTAELCGEAWAPDVPANQMQDEDQDGIYTITYTDVAAGSYEFKVTNGTWSQSWGQDGGVANYQLTVPQDGATVEIRFDSNTYLIDVVLTNVEPTPDPVEPDGFFLNVTVEASQTEIQVGDTVDYTIYAHGNGITAMQFHLVIPDGMTYVAGSATVPANLKSDLNWAAVDWTESVMMWTGYNDVPVAFEEGTVVLTFSCTAEAVGSYKVRLYDLLPFDDHFNERTAELTVDKVQASCDHSYEAVVTAPDCTNGGYTTYTCICGDSYVADETAALGHSFADGTCGACGEVDPDYVKPVIKPTLALKAPALEFKDMITVNAFYTAENIDDVVEMGMITYTEQVDVIDINTAAHVIPGATLDESTGRYFSSSQGIHAKFIGDTVYLACYAKLTDGSYVYTKLAGYSPITYATNQLKNSTNTQLKQLVAAMLNYGAAAQNYFGYNTSALANASLTDEQKALPNAYTSDMVQSVPAAPAEKQGIFANNKGFSVRKPAVSFEGAFSINYFFTPAYIPVDGITLYYWNEADFNAADVLTVDNATGAIAMKDEGGQYRGDIEGIAAKDLAKAIYVAAVYSDGTTTWTSGVLGYSIGAYCGSLANGTMADLAKTTAVYGYHAKAYFG